MAWLLRLAGILVSKAQYVQFTHHSDHWHDPEHGFHQIYAKLNQFTNRFFESYKCSLEEFTYPDSSVRTDRVLLNLRKAAAQSTDDLLEFLEFARYRHRMLGDSPRRLVVLSPSAALANCIPSGWAGDNIDFICPWNIHESLLLRLGRSFVFCFLGSLHRRRAPEDLPPSVAVEAAWRLDPKEKVNALFWWWDSGIAPGQVIQFFRRASQPASGKRMVESDSLGIRCVVLNPDAVGESPHLLWKAAPGPAVSFARLWRQLRAISWGLRRGVAGRWIACRATDMLHHSDLFADFLEEFNVRAVFEQQDAGMDYLSTACDAVGSARIGFHWSHLHWPIAYHARLHQVYFAWGSHHVSVMEAAGSCVDHVLLSGCIVRGAHPESGELVNLEAERDAITSKGASRIIALFDKGSGSEAFYEFFLRKVLNDPRCGLLIKPKKLLPFQTQELPELRALYDQALDTGRARLLDWRLSPADAAGFADVTVGLDINSAAIVAALAGHRAVHLDFSHHDGSPFYDWSNLHNAGQNRLLFTDPETLWASLGSYFDNPGSGAGLGRMDQALLNSIDPFRDGNSGKRIGQYVKWYLEAIEQGQNRDDALALATRRYAAEWGENSVARGLLAPDCEPPQSDTTLEPAPERVSVSSPGSGNRSP